MSDVKRFTGFIAVDGSTHTSQRAAIEHSRQVKIKAALKEKFGTFIVADSADGPQRIALDEFIYANAEAIQDALNQEVLTRKKRTPRKAASADSAEQAA